jgi:hypothetical protein
MPSTGTCCDNSSTTYTCQPVPAACNGALACPCAAPLCTCGGCQLDSQPNTLRCECLYP